MDYENEGLLHEMFIRQAEATPDKIAIVEPGGRQLTFRDLHGDSDVLAKTLKRIGVQPDSCVGIYLDKSIEFSVTYIAILKAGGAYLPLDVSYPASLMESVLTDAEPVAVVTSPDLADNIEGVKNIILLDDGWQKRQQEENKDFKDAPLEMTLDNLAYVVYSSGTTGRPKGIMCPHRGSVFSYHHRHVTFPYETEDREACNIFFTWEMLRPLLKGIPMYVIPNTVIYDPPLLCQFIKDHAITRMLFTPSLLEAILNSPGLQLKDMFKSFKQIWFCGEVVTTALMQRCINLLPWIRFINLYSISECHDVACEDLSQYFTDHKDALEKRKFCPAGRILPGVTIVIMDEEGKPQPVGSSGEIYVGGPTLARGYLKRPEMTAARFIQRPESVPASCGDRLYRTGDWGYMLSDGRLEICGRCDSMVKIRGYSIEVQAVEAALMELPMINAALVLVKGAEGEDKFLVSYIVPKGQTTKKEVRTALKQRLPFYMIPSYFIFLSSIPIVQATGKLDKNALPPFEKESEGDADSGLLPSTETEKSVAAMWTKVLKIRHVDTEESFFDLGGHSLLATELLNHIREKFDIDIAVKDLFLFPTISSISKLIDSKLNKSEDVNSPQIQDVNLENEVQVHSQVKVNIDMQLRAFWRISNLDNKSRFRKARVLLTGATGFLGAFLLKELLLQTKCSVTCLVREVPGLSGQQRLENTLKQFGILASIASPSEEQTALAKLFQSNVHVVQGEVALVNLGMNDDDFNYLCTDTDFIIHAAAAVNLVYPYSALHGANVRGTANVVQFACTGKIKPIHYISTDAVFPNGMQNCEEEADISDLNDKLTDGYSQSKWVAEQIITSARKRGIPAAIYRLGNMSGDRVSAHWNPQDFTLMILQACVGLGLAPIVDWEMEMTPVDFAAEFIVRMTYNLSLSLGKTFHVVNDKPLQSRWVFEWMNAHGYPIQLISFKDWKERVLKEDAITGKVHKNLQRIVESYASESDFFSKLSTYKTDNFQRALKSLQMEFPYTDSAMLSHYFLQLTRQKIITPLASKTTVRGKRLSGKVTIVTGASSGIGEAIAKGLASEGAKVALAARRIERLEDLKKQIEGEGGIAVCIQTDVTNREEVKELVRHTESVLGPIDILVNNAGVMYYTMMKNLKEDQWERQIDLNCKGITNCIGGVLDGMLKRNSGHIVNLSSDAGRKGFPGLAVYSGTKFYVEGLSQALRQEVSGEGIRVTCIQPGDVKTELLSHTTDTEAKAAYDGSSNCKILEPSDIANAVIYATTQPDYVGVNEILIEPREAPV